MSKMGEAFVSELSTQGVESRDPETYRALDAGIWTPRGRTGARPGRRVGAGLELEQTSSPEGWRVQPGHVVIVSPTGEVYRCHFPAAKSDVIARPNAGTTRIDRFVARVYDADVAVGASRDAYIERITGQPAASPEVPPMPTGAIYQDLGMMIVPASGTITVTPATQRTVAAGGILPVTTVERDALVAAGEAYPGMVVYNLTTKKIEPYDGTNWGASAATDSGWVDLPKNAGWSGDFRYRVANRMVVLDINVKVTTARASSTSHDLGNTVEDGCPFGYGTPPTKTGAFGPASLIAPVLVRAGDTSNWVTRRLFWGGNVVIQDTSAFSMAVDARVTGTFMMPGKQY